MLVIEDLIVKMQLVSMQKEREKRRRWWMKLDKKWREFYTHLFASTYIMALILFLWSLKAPAWIFGLVGIKAIIIYYLLNRKEE